MRESRKLTIEEIVEEMPSMESYVIASPVREFRACRGPLMETAKGVRLRAAEANALQVKVGDMVRFASLRAQPTGADEVKTV